MSDNLGVYAFISELKGGGARTNLMRCAIGGSDATQSFASGSFSYMCKASNIPGSTLTPIEVPYFGRNVKVAGESREFAPLTTTVVNDEDLGIYKNFVGWFEKFNAAQSNKATKALYSARAKYTTTVTLQMFKKDGDVDQEWTFKGAWPSNMSAIDLNWDTVNTIQEFTVDWQYDYYLHAKANITA